MVYDKGNGFYGTEGIKTTTKQSEEIVTFDNIQKNPKNKYVNSFYKFHLDNKTDCTIYINNSTYGIFLEAGNGWVTDFEDAPIKSIKIKEIGTQYKWVGHY